MTYDIPENRKDGCILKYRFYRFTIHFMIFRISATSFRQKIIDRMPVQIQASINTNTASKIHLPQSEG